MSVRVAFTTPRYAPLLGGTETHVYEVGRHLAAAGVDVTVLTTDLRGELPAMERHGDVTVRRFPAWPTSGDLYWSPRLVDEARSGGYDVVHVQGVHTLLAPTVLRATQHAGVPTVVTFHTGGHSSRVRTALRGAQWRALRRRLRHADALVAVSDHEVRTFARAAAIDPAAIRVIPNGTAGLPQPDQTAASASVTGDPLVASVGRLERYKGHHRLIAALAELRRRRPGARLVIVGRGGYESQLRRLADRLGVAESVTFTAFDHDDRAGLGALVAASDVVALLSEYEAHPVAVMEALGLGRPLVVADAPGLRELAAYELVTVVDRHDQPADVARALAEAADSGGGQAPVLPTWSDAAGELGAVYDAVLRRHNGERSARASW